MGGAAAPKSVDRTNSQGFLREGKGERIQGFSEPSEQVERREGVYLPEGLERWSFGSRGREEGADSRKPACMEP